MKFPRALALLNKELTFANEQNRFFSNSLKWLEEKNFDMYFNGRTPTDEDVERERGHCEGCVERWSKFIEEIENEINLLSVE